MKCVVCKATSNKAAGMTVNKNTKCRCIQFSGLWESTTTLMWVKLRPIPICSDTSIIFYLSTVMLQGNPEISLPTTPSTSPRGRPDEKYNHYKAFWFYPRVSSQSARNTSKNRQPGIIPSRCRKKLNLESRNEMELVDHAWSQASLPERHHPQGQARGSLATWARQ